MRRCSLLATLILSTLCVNANALTPLPAARVRACVVLDKPQKLKLIDYAPLLHGLDYIRTPYKPEHITISSRWIYSAVAPKPPIAFDALVSDKNRLLALISKQLGADIPESNLPGVAFQLYARDSSKNAIPVLSSESNCTFVMRAFYPDYHGPCIDRTSNSCDVKCDTQGCAGWSATSRDDQ